MMEGKRRAWEFRLCNDEERSQRKPKDEFQTKGPRMSFSSGERGEINNGGLLFQQELKRRHGLSERREGEMQDCGKNAGENSCRGFEKPI